MRGRRATGCLEERAQGDRCYSALLTPSGKELACQCRRCKRRGFDPWVSQEDPLEEGMVTHSSILAWRIPCTEEPGRQGRRWGAAPHSPHIFTTASLHVLLVGTSLLPFPSVTLPFPPFLTNKSFPHHLQGIWNVI